MIVLAAVAPSSRALSSGSVLFHAADELDSQSLIQRTVRYKAKRGDCWTPHYLDLFRPIPAVLAEHPEANGNCYFNYHADYLGESSEYRPEFFRSWLEQFTPAQNGREVNFRSVFGENLTTHLDNIWGCYPYDDVMCYAEGWLKGQTLDDVDFSSATAVHKRARLECEKIRQRNNWTGYEPEVTAGAMVYDNNRIVAASECSAGLRGSDCTPATFKDYETHLYPKCLMGGKFTLSSQMAWCYARACLLEGNVVKHGKECYPEGVPAWVTSYR